MKVIPIALANSLQAGVARLSTCWRLTRKDGAVYRFTDAPEDLTLAGELYRANAGVVPSAVEGTASMSVANLDVLGITTVDGIQPTELDAGLFDSAEVDIFMVDRGNPGAGQLNLQSGWLGEVRFEQGKFKAELRGLLQAYSQSIVEVVSKSCRATLGDSRCQVDLSALTHVRTLTAVASRRVLDFAGEPFEAGYFAYGLVEVLTGEAAGSAMEVKTSSANRVELLMPLSLPIVAGDEVRMVAGCDREFPTCKKRFDNVANFRGEPWVPEPIAAVVPKSQSTTDSQQSMTEALK